VAKGVLAVAQLLIPELDEDVRARLDRRARRHGRSVEAEVRSILEQAAREGGLEEPEAAFLANEEKGLGDLMYEHFKDRGLTDEEFLRFNAGVAEINSRSAMRIPDFEADEFEEGPSDK
jgi:plasmid stability protein